MKYYAVINGRKTGVFDDWDDCREQVEGYSGAEYKSFKTFEEAMEYLDFESNSSENTLDIAENTAIAYVDGSYNINTGIYGCGVVMFVNGIKSEYMKGFNNPEKAIMRNVAGEIEGASYAMRYCQNNNIPKLIIYHDYTGIEMWCTGAWAAHKNGKRKYKMLYDTISKDVEIEFRKVKSHSGDKYNNEADALAKRAVGI